MDNMQVFSYNDTEPKKLRVIVVESAPWLLLTDVNRLLRMAGTNTTQLARSLPDSEWRYVWLYQPRSRLEYIVISEKALQMLLYRYATKPGIIRVVNWIRQSVLPHIVRKGGFPASVLHKEYETRKIRRKPATTQPAPVAPTIQPEEKFVVPVTQISKPVPIEECMLSDLWEIEMHLQIAKLPNLSERLRTWAINGALREVRKKKPLDGSDPKILELPEVVGHVTRRVKHKVKDCDDIVLNPVTLIAKHVGAPASKVNAFAEFGDWKRNGADGFWVEVSTPNGVAREFMYTDETTDLLVGDAAAICRFDSDKAA